MEKIKQLGLQMEQDMKATLTLNPKDGFWYDNDDLDVYYLSLIHISEPTRPY